MSKINCPVTMEVFVFLLCVTFTSYSQMTVLSHVLRDKSLYQNIIPENIIYQNIC